MLFLVFFSLDNFEKNYYDSENALVSTLNKSYTLDTENILTMDFLKSNVAITIKIHDPSLYLPTWMSNSIPGVTYQVSHGGDSMSF